MLARRRPITAMLNGAETGSPGAWPSPIRSMMSTPHSLAHPEKYFSIRSAGNLSIPAGTGVCVVKIVPARAASTASVKDRPF